MPSLEKVTNIEHGKKSRKILGQNRMNGKSFAI
jgi:hypothetical protein